MTFWISPRKIEAEHVKVETVDFELRSVIESLSAMFRPRCQSKGLEWLVQWAPELATNRDQIPVAGDESKINEGSRFTFNIPFIHSRNDTAFFRRNTTPAPGRLISRNRFTALIIDDVEENLDVLGQILSAMGAEVTSADSGEEGLKHISQQTFDVILLDIRMPGMDGFEVMNRIRTTDTANKNTKTIAISASTLTHEEDSYRQAGFDAFISKPFLIEDLVFALQNLLEVEFKEEISTPADTWDENQTTPKLPEDLLQRLKEAAENYQTTEFKELLEELRNIAPDTQAFVDHLSKLASDFNMKQILTILNH